MLNSQSPVPLYHQLADILAGQIRSGEYKPGDMIPSETGLAKSHGIGRPTVRQAMDLLVRKGLVRRKRGAGTFVREQVPQVDLFSLAGTSQAFEAKGIRTESSLVEPVCLKPVNDEPANPFNGGEAFFLSRITRVDTLPVLLEEIYLYPALFPEFDKMDLENRSLSQVVSEQYYLEPVAGRQTFHINCLNAPASDLLELGGEDPVLLVLRTLDFPNAEHAVFSKLYCRTDRFAFSQVIGPVTPGI